MYTKFHCSYPLESDFKPDSCSLAQPLSFVHLIPFGSFLS